MENPGNPSALASRLYLQDCLLHLEAILLSGLIPSLWLSKMLPPHKGTADEDPILNQNHTWLQNKPGPCYIQHLNHTRNSQLMLMESITPLQRQDQIFQGQVTFSLVLVKLTFYSISNMVFPFLSSCSCPVFSTSKPSFIWAAFLIWLFHNNKHKFPKLDNKFLC